MARTIDPPRIDHDRLRSALMSAGLRMWDAREQQDGFTDAHDALVQFCLAELLPHLERDERWLLQAQRSPEGSPLAQAMRAENRTMTAAIYELATTTDACEAMALTRVLHTFLAAHDHHEKLLPTTTATA